MEIHTVFIVPYRDREKHKVLFMNYFNYLREQSPDWSEGVKLLFVHQVDRRQFNRGAMKNIGASHVAHLFPKTWKNINLVFHDVDTLPKRHVNFSYATTPGVVAHYYGVPRILGGIVVVKCGDFVAIGGFPNIWGWGYEDNELYRRVQTAHGLTIDASDRVALLDFSSICRLDVHAKVKTVSARDIKLQSLGQCDYIHDIHSVTAEENGNMLDVTSFTTRYSHVTEFRDISINKRAGGMRN